MSFSRVRLMHVLIRRYGSKFYAMSLTRNPGGRNAPQADEVCAPSSPHLLPYQSLFDQVLNEIFDMGFHLISSLLIGDEGTVVVVGFEK